MEPNPEKNDSIIEKANKNLEILRKKIEELEEQYKESLNLPEGVFEDEDDKKTEELERKSLEGHISRLKAELERLQEASLSEQAEWNAEDRLTALFYSEEEKKTK